ncbi:MAG: cupin domain-containing protein [Caldilineaceae bacterium]|nr:cupin domain-containing protein [Caldilineaceae bacterium]
MPFFDLEAREGKELLPGITLRTFWGDQMLLSHVTLAPGAVVPQHSHPHEQGGVVLEGSMTLTIAGDERTVGPGEMYIAPGNVEHSVVAGPDGCIALDIFSPVREEYQF